MANHKRLNDEQERLLVAEYEDGQTTAVLAARFFASEATVLKVLKRHNVPLRRRKQIKLPAKLVEEMRQMYLSGATFQEVAKKYGHAVRTTREALKAVGVIPRPAGFQQGSAHHAWVGGRTVSKDGYVRVLIREDDPLYSMAQVKADGVRYALEHRIVMARHLGRPLRDDETVHHVDGNRANNALENLQLRNGRHGKGGTWLCADCGSCNIVPIPLPGDHRCRSSLS